MADERASDAGGPPLRPLTQADLVGDDPCALFVLDLDDRVLLWNAAAETAFGLPAASVVGQRFRDLTISYTVPGLRAAIEEVRHTPGRGVIADTAVPQRDGEPAHLSIVISRVRDDDGRSGAIVVRATDRSEVRSLEARCTRAEKSAFAARQEADTLAEELQATNEELQATNEELQAANQELQAANDELSEANGRLQDANALVSQRLTELQAAHEADRHKNDFLAMLAHELRGPLAPILSAMRVIAQQPSATPVVQRAREIVERQVQHQARLLEDLLDVARITRGKIQLRPCLVDLAAVATDVLEAARPLMESRGVGGRISAADGPVTVKADPTRLTQVLGNLLTNAAKFTPAGGEVLLSVGREDPDAVIRVRDTGIGIPEEQLGTVFELFTQIDARPDRQEGGLGIGLTLVKRLVELHGGTVTAHSEGRGRGSEFVVRLPAADASEEAEGQVPRPLAPSRHILLVEDNADTREMLKAALELDGHRVDVACDGLEGVERALALRPEVALLDIGLPGLDGYEVARRLRAELGSAIRLIALTGYGQPEDQRRARDAGFDAHLVKPVLPDDVARILAA